MYNDESSLYHYTYRKDGSETPQAGGGQSAPRRPIQEMKPVKKNRIGLKITALALTCALLGGAAGGGVVWAALGRGAASAGGAESGGALQSSTRPVESMVLNSVDSQTKLTDTEVYAANADSVVSINTTATSAPGFFGQTTQTASAGSGFILTADGYIATNYHVVEGADTVKVTLYDGSVYDARYVGGDEDYDIAVIKVEAQNLKPVTLGNSETLRVGDRVLAIGNPLGELTFSMSGGMVSCVNRAINVQGTPFNMIQTDASINPGNSGGPLLNQYGEVVGIVSAKYSRYSTESVEGLGFAIPINDVSAMIEDIMTNGFVTNKPYLGITAMSMNRQLANQFRYDISEGVFVSAVEDGGAAKRAGLQMGDVITRVDDYAVADMEALNAAKKHYSAGDTAVLTVYRQGETLTLNLTWDSVPEDLQQRQERLQNGGGGNSGNSGGEQYGGMNPYDIFNYFFGNRGW